jgi:methylmalonyl-CoA mutase
MPRRWKITPGRSRTSPPAATLIVAGAPGVNEEKWKAAGVDDFVHVRVNNFELNKQMLTKLGVL